MKKMCENRLTGSVVIVAVMMLTTVGVNAATWQGGEGNWTNDNWGLSGGYVGDANNINSNATINSGTVTVSTAIPNSVGEIIVKDATLNIGANMSSTTGEWRFEGNTTINQTAGTVNYTGFQGTTLGYNTQTDNVVWNLSGGSFTNTQRGLSFGRAGSYVNVGSVVLNVSGASSLAFSRTINFNNENAAFNIDASSGATIEVTGNNEGISMASANTSQQAINYNARLEVTGYNAATTLDAKSFMNIYQGQFANGTDPGDSSSVVAFNLDTNGVNAWTTGVLNLGDGTTNAKGDLEVDVTARLDAYAVVLFNYTTLTNGTFGDVTILHDGDPLTLDSEVVVAADLPNGTYWLAYGSGSNDSITLYYNSVPPPPKGTVMVIQ